MEDKKEINDSFDEVIIHKPKPIRLCTQKKNKLSGSVKSTSSTSSNSEKNNSDSNYRNYPKIKRCKNNYRQKTTEIMEKCDMDEFFNEFNNMLTEQMNEK